MYARHALAVALLASCASQPAAPPRVTAPTDARPRLVVLLVIDQWPQWAFVQKRGALPEDGGFARLLREGAWHTGRYPYAATLTGPGHALLGTGQPVSETGIVGNEWWDRASHKIVRAAEAVDGTIGGSWVRVPGLGDAVAAAQTGAKAVSVALKDRAAVLPLGRTGTAVFYDASSAAWRSSMNTTWLAGHARTHPVAPRLAESWTPTDPARLAKLTGRPDDVPGEVGDKGLGATFPHAHTATKVPADAIYATPLGNALTLEMAQAAIAGEALGTDATPDLLVISLSAHDYVGHGWGHESWEAWDMLLRLDGQLASFLDRLDASVGAGRWAMVVTSDHGASPARKHEGGGAINFAAIAEVANRAAVTQLGPGEWVAYAKYPTVYLSAAARALPEPDQVRALAEIQSALRSLPGLARVGLTADHAGNCAARTGDDQAICMALDTERSGEIFFLPKPYWFFEDGTDRHASAHGSLHDYDREVPVLVLPPGRVAHAAHTAPSATVIDMRQIAPTVAQWLGVAEPAKLTPSWR